MILQKLIYRRTVGAALIIFMAVFLSYYFSWTEKFWMTTTAMLVIQTAVGLTARQALQRFFIIILSVFCASGIIFYIHDRDVIDYIAVVFFAVICHFSFSTKLNRAQVVIPLMIGIVALTALIIPFLPDDLLNMRALDVSVGGVFGFVASLLIFPVKADIEFRKEAIPLLNACSAYLSAIINYLYDRTLHEDVLKKKMELEKVWENFPDWVYEAGFPAMMQQGHRHFLIRIEEIRQILFTMGYLASNEYDEDILEKLRETIYFYEEKIQKITSSIVIVLNLQKITEGVDDLSEAFDRLEKKFKTMMPYSLEVLEVNPDYVYIAHFIYELKELGDMWMILARTLR